ncbi:UDP-N-acetyl glucosamine 2-epimerase [Streptomyces sp. NBC_01210]|uniref:UDP-N-acetylglucosamine 2-epimerase n=1 Tax=Streptomyces sp. NBC_01210 TaxID=2903774 RepID=UPI002E13A754|nr:UDP-N-acetyl glucosamine 2-epimerase [Streptomyces sp. NBC_01210]
MRVISVLGGRPHLIKCETIHRAFTGTPARHDSVECWLGAVSDYPGASADFELPKPLETIREQDAGQLVRRLRAVLTVARPSLALLYGDLETTLVGLSVTQQLSVPAVHVESGYRSGDLTDREELIRIAVAHGAHHRIAFTRSMERNLQEEGIAAATVSRFGNPALQTLHRRLVVMRPAVGRPESRPPGLVTFHREENLLDPLRMAWIIGCLEALAAHFTLSVVLFRRTEIQLQRFRLRDRLDALADRFSTVRLRTTLRYTDYVRELSRASFVLTDSSTVQDDCALVRKPCFVMRPTSPRLSDFPTTTRIVDAVAPERLALLVSESLDGDTSAEPPNTHRMGRAYDTSFVELLTSLV